MSAAKDLGLTQDELQFLAAYHLCDERAKLIIRSTLKYLADTRLQTLRQEMLRAGMTQQADGSWKEPS
jgi:hypothetical protein